MASIPATLTSGLRGSERPVLLVQARLPKVATGFLTIIPVGLIIRAVDFVRNRRLLNRTRQRAVDLGFPLDRHMTILVSTERLLVWRRGGGRAAQPLGGVELSDVSTARLPFVGGGRWRFVELVLNRGLVVRFQVEGHLAERFVESLTR
ncbi:MAG TPA: hypothetical protein VGJ86_07905 [Acidimicrobiales bacterium]|jgi:hypothetical protein